MTYTAAPYSPSTQFEKFHEHVHGQWVSRSLDDCLARRAELGERISVLDGYQNLSQSQEAEREDACGTTVVLDELISEKTLAQRSEQIERVRRAAQDPANLERPDGTVGAPPLVKGLGDRRETADETLQRMRSNPWRAEDSGPLAGHTSYGCARLPRGWSPALTPRWKG